jgi:hypothetical protein
MVPDNAGNTVNWLFINGLLVSNQLSLKNVQKLLKYDSNGISFNYWFIIHIAEQET